MRWPGAAFDTFGGLLNGLGRLGQPATARPATAMAAMTLARRRGVIGRLRQGVIGPRPERESPSAAVQPSRRAAAALWRLFSPPTRRWRLHRSQSRPWPAAH